jgi:hypothetical protein
VKSNFRLAGIDRPVTSWRRLTTATSNCGTAENRRCRRCTSALIWRGFTVSTGAEFCTTGSSLLDRSLFLCLSVFVYYLMFVCLCCPSLLTGLYLSVSLYLFPCLSVSFNVCLYRCPCLFLCVYMYLYFSVYLYLCVPLFLCLSVSLCPSISLSICIFVSLYFSVCL